MRKFIPIILVSMILLTSQTMAWNYGEFVSCDAINPKPKITFLTSYGKLIHDLSTSQSGIESLAGGASEKGFFVVGLATLSSNFQILVKKAFFKVLDENHICVLPSEIEIRVGFQNPTIYVAKEIDQKSCKFSQVIRHEQVHQRINLLTLEYFLPLIDETVRNAINEVRAVKVSSTSDGDLKAGAEQLYKFYFSRLNPILEELERARENEQKKLDNITNYKMESELCREFEEKHPDKKVEIHY